MKEPADIYCTGVTLYYLLTLKYPYFGFKPENRDQAYTMILEHPPIPLRAFRPDAPEGLERVLRKAMEKQPWNRWKSAAEMAAALRPYRGRGLRSMIGRALLPAAGRVAGLSRRSVAEAPGRAPRPRPR